MRSLNVLERRMRSAQLAGGIAHNFNNLLTVILGNAQLLREDPRANCQDSLDAIIQAAEKAADLTSQLLAYAGDAFVRPGDLDLSRCIAGSIPALSASVSRNVAFDWELATRLPMLQADFLQINQIVANLIANAGEAIGENQGTIRVRTALRNVAERELRDHATSEFLPAGRYVELEVADSGPGMDAATKARIFEPFFTTKSFGRGLGLSAVAGIVRRQRGAILVDSRSGKGATFRVLLPAAGEASVAVQRKKLPARERSATLFPTPKSKPLARA
jgi:signal transduction histidine kinase